VDKKTYFEQEEEKPDQFGDNKYYFVLTK